MKRFIAGSVIVLGIASGNSSAAPVLQIKGSAGQSVLALNSAFSEALAMAGIENSAIKPAKLRSNGRRLRLPVSGGVIDLDGIFGEINHAGGLRMENLAETKLKLHNLKMELFEGQLQVSGVAQVNGDISGRIPLFDIVISEDTDITTKSNGKLLTRKLGLTQTASDLLNVELGFFVPAGEAVAMIGGKAKLRGYKSDDDSDDSDD